MISYKKHTLNNGLKVLVHEDFSSPMAVVNLLYNVGSRDESPDRTGFAHLFEHLMFGGSKNAPSFDEVVQQIGGNNNAFTSADITNYYMTVPAVNLETAFWLESDRLSQLNIDEEVLDRERKVVIEEFNQRYLNQPYGDLILHFLPMVYQEHPYQWPTIGKTIDHVAGASLEDVKSFFETWYRPNRCILSVAGHVKTEDVFALAEKYFGDIPSNESLVRNLPIEKDAAASKQKTVRADVPQNLLVIGWLGVERLSKELAALDILCEILGGSESSRLTNVLVHERQLCSQFSFGIWPHYDRNLVMCTALLSDDINAHKVRAIVIEAIADIAANGVEEQELQKTVNRWESSILLNSLSLSERALNLAEGELLGNPNQLEADLDNIRNVTVEEIKQAARRYLSSDKAQVLHYLTETAPASFEAE